MNFSIPVVLIIFKRTEKSLQILNRISEVKPMKLYIISDGGRNEEEWTHVKECRKKIEEAINWDCEVIKNYADANKGCFDRIGLGALWVFEREKNAIFLEDDNLPQISFFHFCKEMLDRYKDNDNVLWVCGTNYLGQYEPEHDADYLFTQNMLPCGWASWSNKFTKYYDKDFSLFNEANLRKIKKTYKLKQLYKYDLMNWKIEIEHPKTLGRYISWDYQMGFSIRVHNKLGIVPKFNQIQNIGVDGFSVHGGSSMENIMTERFCGMSSYPLDFPLKHPKDIRIEKRFEKLIGNIILPPYTTLKHRIKENIVSTIKKIFRIPKDVRIKDYFIKKKAE